MWGDVFGDGESGWCYGFVCVGKFLGEKCVYVVVYGIYCDDGYVFVVCIVELNLGMDEVFMFYV